MPATVAHVRQAPRVSAGLFVAAVSFCLKDSLFMVEGVSIFAEITINRNVV